MAAEIFEGIGEIPYECLPESDRAFIRKKLAMFWRYGCGSSFLHIYYYAKKKKKTEGKKGKEIVFMKVLLRGQKYS